MRRPAPQILRGEPALLAAAVVGLAGPSVTAMPRDDGRNWPAYGRDASERFWSPLRQIRPANVQDLGLAWSYELPGVHYAASTPLAVDGVIYFTVDYSVIHAVDARTGRLIWRFDPQAPEHGPLKMRYAWGSRGIAYWDHKIYTATVDGRLIALDARTGHALWSVMTLGLSDKTFISGAPRVFDGKVFIGHGGADVAPVRGKVSAYDARNGRSLWTFFTVPDDPGRPPAGAAMAMAATTWSEGRPRGGGGGTVWNAITYDADLHRIYIGTGNGFPHDAERRSPGGGDNLFLCAIVALDADTGRYIWHYQTNPANAWDYNSAMDIAMTTVRIGGRSRKVLIHAPKNGFLYVIDRLTGHPISAEKITRVTWADRIDLQTGRPVENPAVRAGQAELWPHPSGAHNAASMSVSPTTGLAYIPVVTMGYAGYMKAGQPDVVPDRDTSRLSAWDPARQREVWRVATPGPFNGGVMTTAGGLVFQGQGDGEFNAYDAMTGARLWRFAAGMGLSGTPITYEVGGRQYVSVLAGLGGTGAGFGGNLTARFGWQANVHGQRLLTFVLGGRGSLPPLPPPRRAVPIDVAGYVIDPAAAARGGQLFYGLCASCHGAEAIAGGFAPDLRASLVPTDEASFKAVVHDGDLITRGMPPFGELDHPALDSLRQYLRSRARADLHAQPAAAPAP